MLHTSVQLQKPSRSCGVFAFCVHFCRRFEGEYTMRQCADMDKQTQEYRAHLVEARQKAFEDFDKTVLLLSGGALGVSITFVKDLIGPGILFCKGCLLSSWACWG